MSSLVSGITGTLFGSTDTSAQDLQQGANIRSQAFIERQAEQARRDVINLFGPSAANQQLGFQSAFDVIRGAIDPQLQAFQQGNVGAQQTLLAALPQFQNAILGNAVNNAALQAQTITPDLSFLTGAQFPQFQTIEGLNLNAPPPPTPQPTQQSIEEQIAAALQAQFEQFNQERIRGLSIDRTGRTGDGGGSGGGFGSSGGGGFSGAV